MRKRGLLSPDWADTAAMIFSGRANAAVMNVESHADESIAGYFWLLDDQGVVTVRPVRCHTAESWPLSENSPHRLRKTLGRTSAQVLRKTLTIRFRRQQICSALFGYGRIGSRELMTTSDQWLLPRTQQC
jgi:hypothetical protein